MNETIPTLASTNNIENEPKVNDGDIRKLRNGKTFKIEVESKSEIPYLNKNQKKELKVLRRRMLITGKVSIHLSRWQKKNLLRLYPVQVPKIQACLVLESSDDEGKKMITEETIMKRKKKAEKLDHLQAELKSQGKKLDKKNRIQLKSLMKFLQGLRNKQEVPSADTGQEQLNQEPPSQVVLEAQV